MPTLPVISSQSGPLATMNYWLDDPTVIPQYVLDLTNEKFLTDAVLRTEGSCPSGIVRYQETTPLYGGNIIPDRPEFGEIPTGRFGLGTPRVAFSVDKSLAIEVSEEQHDRNNVDMLAQGMRQTANDFTATWDDAFMRVVREHPDVQTFAALHPWATSGYDIRADILSCMKAIATATDSQGSQLAYIPDTMIINQITQYDLLRSKDFNAEYYGSNIADRNLRYTGKLEQQIMGLDVLVSPRMPIGQAYFMRRKTAGFICDEKPTFTTPLRFNEDAPAWKSAIRRKAAIGIDQPKAILIAHGL